MTSEDKKKIRSNAKRSRMNMSEYILALNEQKKIYVIEGIPELVVELTRIGTNINQIVRHVNSNDSVTEKQLEQILNQNKIVKDIMTEIIKMIFDSEEEIEV